VSNLGPLQTNGATETTLKGIKTDLDKFTFLSTRLLVDGSGVIQPISVASLPLPLGAATETTLAAINNKVITTVSGIQVDGSGVTQPISGSVSISNFPAIQPVSIATMPSTPVTGTFWQATQPVSANDLDIRDLIHTQDSIKVGNGTNFLLVNSDGSINVRLVSPKRLLWDTDIDWNKGTFGSDIEVYGTGIAAVIRPAALSLALAPVAWWHFNDGSGIIAVDSSSNGNNLDLQAGPYADLPIWEAGKLSDCLNFNGNSYASCAMSSSLNILNSLTLEVWIKVHTDGSYKGIIDSDPGASYFLGTGTDGDKAISFIYGGVEFKTNNVIVLDTWQHVVVTYDRSITTVTLYIDGSPVATDPTFNPTVPGNLGLLGVGIQPYTDFDFVLDGALDEVVIYNVALTAANVAFRYNLGVGIETMPGDNFYTSAHYETNIFNSGITDQYWGIFEANESIPTGTTIEVKTRVSNIQSAMGSYGSPLITGDPIGLVGQYIQFSVDFTGTSLSRAFLDSLSVIFITLTPLDIHP